MNITDDIHSIIYDMLEEHKSQKDRLDPCCDDGYKIQRIKLGEDYQIMIRGTLVWFTGSRVWFTGDEHGQPNKIDLADPTSPDLKEWLRSRLKERKLAIRVK